MRFGIPVAWLQLKQDKLRLLVALLGVAFAVILILMQLGFQEALFSSAVRFHNTFRYDIVMISPKTKFMGQPSSFTRRRIYQALSHPNVSDVSGVYLGAALWKNPVNPSDSRLVYAVGFDPSNDDLLLEGVEGNLDRLKMADVALFDRKSRPEFGPVPALLEANEKATGRGVFTEINDRRIQIVDLYSLGTSFGVDASIVTSDVNFLKIFPDRPVGLIDLGLIDLEKGADAQAITQGLKESLAADVEVLTREAFVQREVDYWNKSTPIGYVFNFGVIVGIFVGSIIVYQILFADVSDNLQEYATLKAMGYSNGYLFGLVFQEALMMAVLGYIPGFLITLTLYSTASAATQLPLEMNAGRAVGVLLLTIAMCMISGAIAVRKVRTLDPADVY
ncbi:ABC transporter permease DevC [Myxococcota bacterium]|nr:ABC transporter permease DevC [Myxococcota bacterium]